MRRFFWFLRRIFARGRYQADLRRELDATHELLAAEFRAKGMSEEQARRAARRELGGSVDAIREDVQDAWSGAWLERFGRDARYALRGLRRDRGFAVASILTFGLAIGGTTAVATLVSSLLLSQLPFADADRLVMVMERANDDKGYGTDSSEPNIADWRVRNRSIERLAFFEYQSFNVATNQGVPLQVGGLRASHELFDVLGAKPLLGRTFIELDDESRNGDVVILSHALWHERFADDSSLVGRSILINKKPHTVIGVMRPELRFPAANQKLWTSMTLSENDRSRQSHSFFSVARLKSGVTLEQARSDMRRIGDELAREYPEANKGESVNVFPLRELWMQNIERILRLLMAAVTLVAIMAVVNVAGLLLARGGARSREFGARLALGGSRGRLISQLVTESAVVAALGGVLGVAIAYVVLPLFVALPGLGLDYLPFRAKGDVAIDVRILIASLVVAIISGILAGAIPAFSVVPRSPAELLREGDARGSTAKARHSVRSMLLSIETGLAVVVLVGAALLVDSVRRAGAVEPGLDARNVFLMGLALPQKDFYGIPERQLFCSQLAERAGSAPGVLSISAVSHVPFSGAGAGRGFTIEGRAAPAPHEEPSASYGVVCPNYFHTMGIAMRAGQDFSARDVVAAPQVAIVNETFQKRYFSGESAVGKRIRLGDFASRDPWITIIAVTGDVRQDGLVSDLRPFLYRPYSQTVWPSISVAVRTATSSRAVVDQVKEGVRAMVPDEPIGEPITMQSVVDSSLGFMRFPLYMMLAFSGIAILLTVVGVFGVASQIVVQRTRELGIRRALGATSASLYRLVVVQTLMPAAIGMVAGIVVALSSGKVLNGLLYGVSATDISTFAVTSVLLGTLTVCACVAPARRAAGVDPARTLRND
jgi:putative ABC transport system permease protein